MNHRVAFFPSPYHRRWRDPRAGQLAGRALGGTPKRTLLIVSLLCLWEGLPFALIGLPNIIGLQIYALVVFAGTGAFISKAIKRKLKLGRWEGFSISLFFLCVLVSFIYSNFVRPQPLVAWIFAIYSVAPVLTLLALRALGCTIGDAIAAIFWTGFIGSVVVTATKIFDLGILNFYSRGSAFTDSRVVFLKLETTFCLVIATIRLLHAKSGRQFILYALALAFTSYSTFVLTESRLAIMAVAIALVLTWLFIVSGKQKILIFLLAPVIVIPTFWFVSEKYLASFQGLDSYLSADTSASWREITINHFRQYFSETFGMGFGFMSANPAYNNVISYSSNYASVDYGVTNYAVGLDDIGIYSALYQYGYLGFVLISVMTLMMIYSLFKSINLGPGYRPVAATGALTAAFLISPISMNYFTLFYTGHIGGLLWFMAAESSRLRKTIFCLR